MSSMTCLLNSRLRSVFMKLLLSLLLRSVTFGLFIVYIAELSNDAGALLSLNIVFWAWHILKSLNVAVNFRFVCVGYNATLDVHMLSVGSYLKVLLM